MAKFITVLNSDMNRDYWSAVQEAATLADLRDMGTYQAGNSSPYDKKDGDTTVGQKQVEEEKTGINANATMIELGGAPSASILTNVKHKFSSVMKNIGFSILILAIAWPFIISCTTNGHLTRRYKSITYQPIDTIDKWVAVQAFMIEPEENSPAPKKSIFDLSPQAQKELIKQFGYIETQSAKLIEDITKPLSSKPPTSVDFIDYTKFQKRVVLTIRNVVNYPADRISKANVKLTLDSKVRLLSCNRLATEFQNIDLGKLDFSNTLSGELSGNLGTGLTGSKETDDTSNTGTTGTTYTGDNADNSKYSGSNVTQTANGSIFKNSNIGTSAQGLNGKLSGSRSFAEEVLLKQRIVSLNASITDNTLSLFQESISGIDITGNIIADIVFDGNSDSQDMAVKKTFTFSDLMDDNKKINDPDKISVKETIVTYYNFSGDITATLEYDAKFRHVTKGDKTITESDDKVTLYFGTYPPKDKDSKSAPTTITILKKNQLMPRLFILKMKDPAASKIPVFIQSPTGTKGELLFNDYDEAKNFFIWLGKAFPGPYDSATHQMKIANGYSLIFPTGFSKPDELVLRVW